MQWLIIKLTDIITSYTKLINNLSAKFKLISTKGLTKDLIMDIVFIMVQNILLKMTHKIILRLNLYIGYSLLYIGYFKDTQRNTHPQIN